MDIVFLWERLVFLLLLYQLMQSINLGSLLRLMTTFIKIVRAPTEC
jgi:hypothetical protein